MAKYKVGDKVRVRCDLEPYARYFMEDGTSHDWVVSDMMNFRGKIVTIEKAHSQYRIKEDQEFWAWTDEMFEGLAEQEFHEFDTVKHKKYGIGTVIGTVCDEEFNIVIKVDFDEWNEDHFSGTVGYVPPEELTLIKAYLPK